MEQNFTHKKRCIEFSIIITQFLAALFQFSSYLGRKIALKTLDLLFYILAVVTQCTILGPALQLLF